MDERVLGDMPSEGSESSRRFGIFRAYSPDPKMHSFSRARVLFVLAIAAVVAFAVFFPMIQYASKGNQTALPYPELVNRTHLNNRHQFTVGSSNCSSDVFSFGFDCAESRPKLTEHTDLPTDQIGSSTTENAGEVIEVERPLHEENNSGDSLDLAETRNFKFQRVGRSGWPLTSTPYPYYGVLKPTLATNNRHSDDQFEHESNIFAIPLDMGNDSNLKQRINFTPPPYVFTPFPNFTDSYAQLSPYKIPNNSSNVMDIMKYLKTNGPIQNISTERSDKVISSRAATMKVSGTYIMPLDRRRPGEIIVSSYDVNDDIKPLLNGHAYVTDPFMNFRPSNPLEINRLIPLKTGLELGPRFRKPVTFVPTSSVAVDIGPGINQSSRDLEAAGSHTVAIFHPPGRVPKKPTIKVSSSTEAPKEKPLSVTLDIYPVTMEVTESTNKPSTFTGKDRGRLNPKWRPRPTERPRWRPNTSSRPTAPSKLPTDNHMIVHLNLFPNKRKPYASLRRGRTEETTETTSISTSGQQQTRRLDTQLPEDIIGRALEPSVSSVSEWSVKSRGAVTESTQVVSSINHVTDNSVNISTPSVHKEAAADGNTVVDRKVVNTDGRTPLESTVVDSVEVDRVDTAVDTHSHEELLTTVQTSSSIDLSVR